MAKTDYHLGNAKGVFDFIETQIDTLKKSDHTFEAIFERVFCLRDNVMAERSDGNRIFSITYGESRKRIFALCGPLSASLADVPGGSLVGICMDNRLEWLEVFWALLRCGYRPLLINKRLPKDQLEEVLSTYHVGAVITDGEHFSVPTIDWESLYKSKPLPAVRRWANEVVFMSSGTSSAVKLCVYDGECICQQIYNTLEVVKKSKKVYAHVDGYIRLLAFLPFYHVFGFLASYIWYAFFGRTFVFLNNYNGDTILKTVRLHKVTHIFAVPLLWMKIEAAAKQEIASLGKKTEKKFCRGLKLINRLGGMADGLAGIIFREVREKIFGDSVKFMITGGGVIPCHTLEFFNGIGYPLSNGFGMTEIGIASVELSRKRKVINSGSVGQPFASVKYEIRDGELNVQGRSFARQIWKNGKRCPAFSGWFPTDDLASHDSYGWHILGRRDDMVISSTGENICPDVLENRLSVPGADFVLIGLPSPEGGVRSVLLVSVRVPGEAPSIRDQVMRQLSEKGLTACVDEILLTGQPLMKGTEIKLNRRRIRNDLMADAIPLIGSETEGESGRDAVSGDLRQELSCIFGKILRSAVTEEQYDANFFYDLNGDSLGYFELAETLKKKFGVDILSEKGTVLSTVNEVSAFIEKNRGGI